MKANKGEWSEFYAFLKILEDKKLFAADNKLEIIAGKFFIFKKIIRSETNKKRKIFELKESEICILDDEGNLLKKIKDEELKGKTLNIFKKIKNSKGTTFEIPEAEVLMQKLLCSQLKSDNSKKSDIDGVVYDRVSDKEDLLGFSVKSMIGGASTLLNAGETTNFVYEVKNLSPALISKINNISSRSKIQDRLKAILKNGGILEFYKIFKPEFEINLRKIDTIFPIFLSQMLLDFFMGNANKVSDLIDLLDKNENLKKNFRLSKSDYEYKMKNLLISAALGMVPGKEWDGFTKAHGGYIVVKNNGDVICYHLYNRDEFISYLYENTKFESASSTRHKYGKIYREDNKMYLKLNLQIRFLA
ncbi:MAG: HpaII family restriction endonuclease [Candidatus Gracilibacteria bacterium]|jgi:type II restriction enzyme